MAETAPSNGTPLFAAGLVRRGELVELSPPPAEIFVVVGEDTNNGRWPNGDMKRIVASDENENLSPDSHSALCPPAANAVH